MDQEPKRPRFDFRGITGTIAIAIAVAMLLAAYIWMVQGIIDFERR